MSDFLPPIDDPFAVALAKLLLPIAKLQAGLEINISPACMSAVKALRGKHAVLMINHSDRYDPLCACALARACNENFYFIASREQFDRYFGFAGWVLQHLGAYSVIRGHKVEQASAKKTVSVLVEGKHKLAEFPEGDVTGRDDKIFPLKEDGVHNLFSAQKTLNDTTGESITVLPIAMYYSLQSDSTSAMIDCLQKIEARLDISTIRVMEFTLEQRLKRVVSSYILHLENLYGFSLRLRQGLSSQLREISREISLMAAKSNGLTVDPAQEDAVLLYDVRAELRRKLTLCSQGNCGFSASLMKESDKKQKLFTADLDRAEQLLILASTLESKVFTPEIAWRVLDRLENEILGKSSPKGRRTAWIDAGAPIDLKPLLNVYLTDSLLGISKLDAQVRSELFKLMQTMQRGSKTTVLV